MLVFPRWSPWRARARWILAASGPTCALRVTCSSIPRSHHPRAGTPLPPTPGKFKSKAHARGGAYHAGTPPICGAPSRCFAPASSWSLGCCCSPGQPPPRLSCRSRQFASETLGRPPSVAARAGVGGRREGGWREGETLGRPRSRGRWSRGLRGRWAGVSVRSRGRVGLSRQFAAHRDDLEGQSPPWSQPRGKSMVSLVNSATRIGWHLWEVDLRFAHGLPPGWTQGWAGREAAGGWTPLKTACASGRCAVFAFEAHRLLYHSA